MQSMQVSVDLQHIYKSYAQGHAVHNVLCRHEFTSEKTFDCRFCFLYNSVIAITLAEAARRKDCSCPQFD